MAVKNSTIQIRIDSKTKNGAKKIFEGIGLDMSSAIKLFLKQTVNLKGFPLDLRDENGIKIAEVRKTLAAMKEVDENQDGEVYTNVKDFMQSLKED